MSKDRKHSMMLVCCWGLFRLSVFICVWCSVTICCWLVFGLTICLSNLQPTRSCKEKAPARKRNVYICRWKFLLERNVGGPVAQSGQSGGLLIRRPRVQFPSGPPHHTRIFLDTVHPFWLFPWVDDSRFDNADYFCSRGSIALTKRQSSNQSEF